MPVRDIPVYLPRAMESEPENGSTPTFESVAIPFNTFALSSDANIFFRRMSHWLTAVAATRLTPARALYSGSARIQCLDSTKPGIQFDTLTGSLTVSVTGALFHTERYYLSLSDDVLALIAQNFHTFPANTSVWVYASGAPIDRGSQIGGQGTPFPGALPSSVDLYFDDVGTGNPPAPPAGYYVVGGATSDGIQVVSNDGAPYIGLGLSFGQNATWLAGTTIFGDQITLDHVANSTALSVTSGNNFAPAVFVTGQVGTTGTLIQAQGTVSTVGASLLADNPGPGSAIEASKFSGGGTVFTLQNFGTGNSITALHAADNVDAMQLTNIGADSDNLVSSSTDGAPFVATPQFDPTTTTPGSFWVDSATTFFSFRIPGSAAKRRLWGTDWGLAYDRERLDTLVSTFAASYTLVTVTNFTFRQFARYKIEAEVVISKINADSLDTFTILVNGVPIPECNAIFVRVNQELAALTPDQIVNFTVHYQHTAASVTANVDFTSTAGALGTRYKHRVLQVQGHFR